MTEADGQAYLPALWPSMNPGYNQNAGDLSNAVP